MESLTPGKTFLAIVMIVASVALVGCRGGITTGIGVDQDKRIIRLGLLAPQTGPVAVVGLPMSLGQEVYFQYVNEDLGGVGSSLDANERYKIELIARDTVYSTETHVEQYNDIRERILALSLSLGTQQTKAILSQLTEDQMLAMPGTLSADWLSERVLVLPGAPYQVQFLNAAQYLADEGKLEGAKVGIVYQEDEYGTESLRGLEFAASRFEFEILETASYMSTDTDFSAQVEKMKAAGATIVFLGTVPSATQGVAEAAIAVGYTPRFIGLSRAWIESLSTDPVSGRYLAKTLWIVDDATCQWGAKSKGCVGLSEMVQNIKKFAPDQKPDRQFQFGYTQARITHQLIEAAIRSGDLTRTGMLSALDSLKGVDMGGLLPKISYGSSCEERIPSTASTIFQVDRAIPTGLKTLAPAVDSPTVKEYPFCD